MNEVYSIGLIGVLVVGGIIGALLTAWMHERNRKLCVEYEKEWQESRDIFLACGIFNNEWPGEGLGDAEPLD